MNSSCAKDGCPHNEVLFRVSPYGEEFVGACETHFREMEGQLSQQQEDTIALSNILAKAKLGGEG